MTAFSGRVTVPIATSMQRSGKPRESVATPAATSRWLGGAQILSLAVLGGAVAINDGRLHWQALHWLAMAVLALAGGMILCRGRITSLATPRMLHSAMLLIITANLVHLAVGGTTNIGPMSVPRVAMLACLLTINIGLIFALATRLRTLGVGLMIGGFGAAAWAMVWTAPHVRIDVLAFQRESSAALLNGQNPYHARYRNVYHPDTEFYGTGSTTPDGWLTYSFPYPPASLLLSLPGALAGDVRYSQAAAICLAALLLVAAGRNQTAILAAGLLLTSPRLLHVVQMGWTEPLLIFLAAAVIYAAIRARWMLWAAIGAFLASKQYLVLAVPLLPLLRGARETSGRFWKTIVLAGVLAMAVTAPFVLMDPHAFVRSTVEWQLVQPFRYDALSFPAMIGQLGGAPSGGLLGFVAGGIAILLALWKAPRTAGGFFASAALVFCCFFACNKQAFCNYYQLVIGLSCCAIVGLSVTPDNDTAARAGPIRG